ncbi:hypothetical protein B0H10DRAFT_2214204 [Mycena sp. CBHHK59/15]|nr:hypothetical protein B0H10DRAFT_2214204 [Mycena sp. CBHHK59/15]
MHDILGTITKDLDGLGIFLELLFYNRPHGVKDARTKRHKSMVSAFLGGQNTGAQTVKMGRVIELIYNHRQSQPPTHTPERELAFSSKIPHIDISYARPSLSSWALVLVGKEARRQIGNLTENDATDPTDTTQIRAATNGRVPRNARAWPLDVASWEKLMRNLSIPYVAKKYETRGPVPWYLSEMMAASTKGGVIVRRQRRPHTTIQVGAISSFVLSRNRYASGYLALPLAVWQFACKSHVDEKRIFSRFGFTQAELRASVAEGVAIGEMRWQYVLDNVQEWCRQRDMRLGRQDVLKVGCAATALLLEDCAPGAFNLQDHLDRVMKQERKEMTTESFCEDIDWDYIHELTALHWVRILVTFIPQLAYLRVEVAAAFDSPRMTKHRLRRNRRTVAQPLMTNAERETETAGMMRAMLDFEGQMGLDEQAMKDLMITPRGDGASIAAMWRIKKYLAAHPNHYKAFRNRVPPGPEIWHTRWTKLNAIASNCYGPSTSTDPSSLSKSATAAGAKRPTDLKKVDFFPTSRSMTLFFEARVLDCWRIFFGANDIITYFQICTFEKPDLETLWAGARKLVRRYASQEAYHQALSGDFAESASEKMKIPSGTPWTAPIDLSARPDPAEVEADPEENVEGDAGDTFVEPGEEALEENISEQDETEPGKKRHTKKKTAVHTEAPGFSGDRSLANEVLFLQDMGWWVIAAHAVPDGEIGRVWEIMKIWTLCFSGSSNRNYANYLLEAYCLHRYESSKDFSDAMLNNWLVNLSGKKWTECDFSQEGFNKWLEEMVEHKGGDFDDNFYRHTLSPNVLHFLRIKEQIQEAFELKHRSKTHSAPHLRNEFQQLLRMHREDELHLFRPGRTMGHAAVNYFERGYQHLEDGRMDHFIEQSTAYSDIMIDVLRQSPDDPEPTASRTEQEELDRLIQYAIENPDMFPDDSDSEEEDDGGDDETDNEGDIGIHGLEYSDDEEFDDAPEGHHGRATDELEADSQDDEGLNSSEGEEEDLDQDIPIGDEEEYSTDEE